LRTTLNRLVAASSIAILLSACSGGTGTTPGTTAEAFQAQNMQKPSALRPHNINQTFPCVLPTVPAGDGVKCTRQPSVAVTGFGIGSITPGYITNPFGLTVLVNQDIPCYDTSVQTYSGASTLVTFYDASGNQLYQQDVNPNFVATSCDEGNGEQYAGVINLGSLTDYYKGTSTIDHVVFKDSINFQSQSGASTATGTGTFYPELLQYVDGAPVKRGGGGVDD
jgi:hypothetical protein